MKTNGKPEVMARIARQSLVFAALVAMVLSTAGISGAQVSAASQATPAVKPAAAPAKAPASPAAKPAKGQHEGITVHGHWVIEVKNPDGKVVSHTEFENALQSFGQVILADLLSNQYVQGGWSVELCTTGGASNCPASPAYVLEVMQQGAFNAQPEYCNTSGTYGVYCWPSLTIPPSSIGTTVELMGNIPSSPLSGTVSIDTVNTYLALCPSTVSSPVSIASCFMGNLSPQGQPGNIINLTFTGASVTPVSVQFGQAISVIVTFSFGSGT